jgi:hypothetical protein
VAPNPRGKARSVYALLQGALTQARILDDLEIVRDAHLGVFDLLGIAVPPASGGVASSDPGTANLPIGIHPGQSRFSDSKSPAPSPKAPVPPTVNPDPSAFASGAVSKAGLRSGFSRSRT